MATKLRMARFGSKKRPFYRIVAADSRAPRDGRFIEQVGYFNPSSNELKIDRAIALKWLGTGAQPSDSVKDLFTQVSIMEEFHMVKAGKKFTGSIERKEQKTSSKVKKAAKKPAPVVEEVKEEAPAVEAAAPAVEAPAEAPAKEEAAPAAEAPAEEAKAEAPAEEAKAE